MVARITSADAVKYCLEIATPLAVPSQLSGGVSALQGSGDSYPSESGF